MRPKKRILLVDTNHDRMGCMRFLLDTHGYAVLSASTARQAEEIIENAEIELMFTIWPIKDPALEALLRKANDTLHVPWLLSSLHQPTGIWPGDGYVIGISSSAEILERVKSMSARKRGPKPGFKIPPASADPLLVEELQA